MKIKRITEAKVACWILRNATAIISLEKYPSARLKSQMLQYKKQNENEFL